MNTNPLLQVTGLKVHFQMRRQGWFGGEKKWIRAVDGLDFTVAGGETFGLVGESGCGKSTTARAVLRLISATEGFIAWKGKRIDQLSERAMLPYRRQMQMIFQDPFASLNPRMTVGAIIAEPMRVFGEPERSVRKLEVMHLMERVGLNPRFLNRYPHEFSGGQRQRIGIARALALSPELIFCDEPVSALDVSIQAQVINLLRKLKEELSLSYVFIAHDLSVVRHISDRIGVMYLGRLVEVAPSRELYRRPRHPYTRALLSAVPLADPAAERERRRIRLEGEVPSPDRVYSGCPLADRCPRARAKCREVPPKLEGETHRAACFFPYD
jgi:oligopeptide transport system ATP-binding protein